METTATNVTPDFAGPCVPLTVGFLLRLCLTLTVEGPALFGSQWCKPYRLWLRHHNSPAGGSPLNVLHDEHPGSSPVFHERWETCVASSVWPFEDGWARPAPFRDRDEPGLCYDASQYALHVKHRLTAQGFLALSCRLEFYHGGDYDFCYVLADAPNGHLWPRRVCRYWSTLHDTYSLLRDCRIACALRSGTPWPVVADWLEDRDREDLAVPLRQEIERQRLAGMRDAY